MDISLTPNKISALKSIGVPYPEGYEDRANDDLMKQAEAIALDLQKNGIPAEPDKEIIALIAYLQKLGTDIKAKPVTENR